MTSRRRAPRTPEQRQQQWTRSLIPGSLAGGVANASPILPGVTDGRALARGAGGAFGAGGAVLAHQDVFTLTAAGAQSKTLTYLPIPHSEHVYLNGLYQRETDDWIRTDRTINVQAAMDARIGDVLAVEYLYASAVPVAAAEQTYTLNFQIAPDNVASGGASHTSTALVKANGTSLGTFTSNPESGNDGVHEWTSKSVALPSGFNPAAATVTFEYNGGQDTLYIRRVNVTSSGSAISYGEFPPGYAYTAGVQDLTLGVDGSGSGQQYSMATGALVSTPTITFHFTRA